MNVLVIAEIQGRIDLLHLALRRALEHDVDAVFALGSLIAPQEARERSAEESFQRILDELDLAGCPVYLLPGPHDVPLEALLDELQAQTRSNPIILIHRIVARCSPIYAVAGYGGLVAENAAPEAELLQSSEQAVKERFAEMASYNPLFQNGLHRIFLFTTPPRDVVAGGSATIARVIAQYTPRLVCFHGAGVKPLILEQDATLLVNPGALCDGRYAIVNLERLDAQLAHLKIGTALAGVADRRILVPLDGFPSSELILPQVVAVAKKTISAITLLHVLPEQQAAQPPDPLGSPDYVSASDQSAFTRYYLEAVARRLRSQGLTVTTELLRGDPATSILIRLLRSPTVQIVALASNTRRPQRRQRAIGGVVQQLLYSSPIPLLLLQPERGTTHQVGDYHTLLIPLDGTAESEQALEHVRQLYVERNVSLVLVAVAPEVSPLAQINENLAQATLATTAREKHERLSVYLKVLAHRLSESGFAVRTRLVTGRPDEQILRLAEEEEADLIVMATHATSHVRQMLPGSTALQVVRTTTLPVLLIRSTSSPTREVWESNLPTLSEAQ